jgi:hypothetical protein
VNPDAHFEKDLGLDSLETVETMALRTTTSKKVYLAAVIDGALAVVVYGEFLSYPRVELSLADSTQLISWRTFGSCPRDYYFGLMHYFFLDH